MTQTLDATGLLCPLPVLKLRKRLQALTAGETITLITDDPAAVIDVPHFCAESGNVLDSQSENGATMTWIVRKV